jgi:hypothetical protein
MIKVLSIKYILVVPNCVPPLSAVKNSGSQKINPGNYLKAAFFSTLFIS